MLWFFFDSSAIVKRYHLEKGTEIVNKVFDSISNGSHRGIITPLVVLELISASRRKVSSKEITGKKFIDGVASFLDESSENLSILAIESSMYTDAADYVIRHGLSAPDSIHLVSVHKITQTVDKSKVVLASSDKKLCDSAEKEGFRTLNPEQVAQDRVDKILRE